MSKSMFEQFEAQKVQIGEFEKTVKALMDSLDLAKQKSDESAKQVEGLKSELESTRKDHAEAVKTFEAKLQESSKSVEDLTAQLKTAKDKLELAPFKDVSAGQKPVPDGAPANTDPSVKTMTGPELIAKVESLHGPERMKFYQEHKAAIDAAYDNQK